MDKEPITVIGLEKLKKELIFLKDKKRPEIVEAIAEARSHGDLKENAEYHAAKEQQAQLEGRVIAINDLIARANVIDVTKIDYDDKVIFGDQVFPFASVTETFTVVPTSDASAYLIVRLFEPFIAILEG